MVKCILGKAHNEWYESIDSHPDFKEQRNFLPLQCAPHDG